MRITNKLSIPCSQLWRSAANLAGIILLFFEDLIWYALAEVFRLSFYMLVLAPVAL